MDPEHAKGATGDAKIANQGSAMSDDKRNSATTKVDKHAPNLVVEKRDIVENAVEHRHDDGKKLRPEVKFDRAQGAEHHKLDAAMWDAAKKSADYGQD
jgi:hypothetical protein